MINSSSKPKMVLLACHIFYFDSITNKLNYIQNNLSVLKIFR